ncbi:AraC family transcriptional regulator [Sphingomonas sp. Leaf407]|uniref:AraC family transcriptional regulator n=1 Tax=unclassified Sphingomonas TaxID=196159 RepID=UPI0006F52010|nr:MULTISPECIES: AraC family transcriptional regulator [unclassified Sphingomonas]KQN37100.1 AraC family transcriptional regulator [Sphingomonas sp. Leaf42]KQT30527.1 AraC family transcriptional regulator [Sphingomonas sp. Leaf407]
MTDPVERYTARLRRVLAHIDRHPDAPLDLDRLSAIAAFSPCHFHRQFGATIGLSLHRYVQLSRMERAAHALAFRGDVRVTDVAIDAGYDSPDAFARAFRRRFGQSPSGFRAAPDWRGWAATLRPFHQARSQIMTMAFTLDDVTIRTVDPVAVAMMRHIGDPATIGDTIRRFIAWRQATGTTPPASATYTVFHDDPQVTPPEAYRMDLCAATGRAIGADEPVAAGTIPGGRCAVLRVVGDTHDLEPAARFLYGTWLPQSGEQLRDFPLYCQRVRFFPDVPAQEAIVDLFLPII